MDRPAFQGVNRARNGGSILRNYGGSAEATIDLQRRLLFVHSRRSIRPSLFDCEYDATDSPTGRNPFEKLDVGHVGAQILLESDRQLFGYTRYPEFENCVEGIVSGIVEYSGFDEPTGSTSDAG